MGCYVVHDAICCGTGIGLETIGTFYYDDSKLDPKFEPDNMLVKFMEARRSSTPRNSAKNRVFFFTSPEPGKYEKHEIPYAKR
jgi:hypothetical protein